MEEKKSFQQECDDYVKGVAERIENLYYGNDTDELEEELEELELNEPEEPDEDAFETEEEYDKAWEVWEKEHDDWLSEFSKLSDKIDELKDETLDRYFDDCLDISYIVNASKEYESVRVWVTIGGPSVYIDTDKGAVVLNWGSSHSEYYLSGNVVNAIDNIFEEQYNW